MIMKYVFKIIVIVLIAAGIFLGFNIDKKDANTSSKTLTLSDNGTNSTTKSSTNTKVLDLSNKGMTKVSSDVYSQTVVKRLS
jgi:phosphotransferase system  glucose/maltose/N-acetylglucosamine-specific IIC component